MTTELKLPESAEAATGEATAAPAAQAPGNGVAQRAMNLIRKDFESLKSAANAQEFHAVFFSILNDGAQSEFERDSACEYVIARDEWRGRFDMKSDHETLVEIEKAAIARFGENSINELIEKATTQPDVLLRIAETCPIPQTRNRAYSRLARIPATHDAIRALLKKEKDSAAICSLAFENIKEVPQDIVDAAMEIAMS